MTFPKTVLSNYTYDLPDSKIAYNPALNRGDSKLLAYANGNMSKKVFCDLAGCLSPKDTLYFNNAKVIPARLHFTKETGAQIEVFLIEPDGKNYTNLYAKEKVVWKCLIGNKKRWKEGTIFLKINNINLKATWKDRVNNLIEFDWDNGCYFSEILQDAGKMPLPPYIKREAKPIDSNNYQTIYAKEQGAVAAPTAGLHFTDEIMQELANNGINKQEITLYVGAGTFKPVTVEDASEHDMHSEKFSIKLEVIKNLLNSNGRVVCVGTTSVRVLESIYWMGVKLLHKKENPFELGRKEVYSLPKEKIEDSLNKLMEYMKVNNLNQLEAETGIFIVPGYLFKLVDVLITNFHQPGSTLIMLVAAFVGEDWRKIYNFALGNDFRFLSYGDSSILTRKIIE